MDILAILIGLAEDGLFGEGGHEAQFDLAVIGTDERIAGRGDECALDLAANAGRITFTGWPKKETSLPTDLFTKKELDLRGARNSAREFEEAIELVVSGRVDIARILTKTISLDEAPETIADIEKNPGNYMKVVVNVSE